MDINFFDPKYLTEAARDDSSFGLSDDNKMAFTTNDPSLIIAEVSNPANVLVQFVAVDHYIIVKDTLGQDVSMCDAMIYTPDKSPKKDIHFIELKDQMANWRQKAISQLESTIQIFSQNHVLEDFRYRVATAANKAHPQFNFSTKEDCQAFRKRNKFRLNVCSQIDIKQ